MKSHQNVYCIQYYRKTSWAEKCWERSDSENKKHMDEKCLQFAYQKNFKKTFFAGVSNNINQFIHAKSCWISLDLFLDENFK